MKLVALPLWLLLWSCSNTLENRQDKKTSTSAAIKNKAESSGTNANQSKEEFNTFIQRFSQDSSFQRARIVFPIKITSTNGEKKEVKMINKQDWEYTNYSHLNLGQTRIGKVKYGLINLIYTVEDTGVLVYHYFHKRNKKWVLVSIEDHST